jgi:hypothetical protein
MAYKYAYPGPPFHFLGHLSASQWAAFKKWQAKRQNFDAISMHHRIRAQQLRKTAGVLEQFYSTVNDQALTPSPAVWMPDGTKPIWKPGPAGHFNYAYGNDHIPMVTMSKIKNQYKEQLQRDEEGVFAMNQVRCLIEKHEDAGQYSYEFTHPQDAAKGLTGLLSKIDSLFAKPEYRTVLVSDLTDLNNGLPQARVNQADDMVPAELDNFNHSKSYPYGGMEQGDFQP